MKNSLSDLNNHLFEQIERLNDEDLNEEGLEKEIKRSKAMQGIASAIIENGRLALQVAEHIEEYGVEEMTPKFLLTKKA